MAKAGRSGRIATVLGHLKPRRRARPQFVNRTRLSIPTFLGSRAADKVLLLRHFKAALDRIANPETPPGAKGNAAQGAEANAE